MPLFDFTDPNIGALAGFVQGMGQAAIPTRVKTPIGASLGMGVGGMMQGAAAAQQLQQQQAQTALAAAQAVPQIQQANILNGALGQPQFDTSRLRGMLSSGAPQGQGQPGLFNRIGQSLGLVLPSATPSSTTMTPTSATSGPQTPMGNAITTAVIGKLYGGDTDLDKLIRSRAIVAAQGGDTTDYDRQITKLNSMDVRGQVNLAGVRVPWAKNPPLAPGMTLDENGEPIASPQGVAAVQSVSGAHELGETQNKLFEVTRNGVTQWVSGSQLMPGDAVTRTGAVAPDSTKPSPVAAQAAPIPKGPRPQAAALGAAPFQAASSVTPPTNLPAWMPQGGLPQTLSDAFGPNYQSLMLTGPKVPNQATPTEGQVETGKDAADKLNEYQDQAATEGPVYNNIRQMGQIIQNGYSSGAGANAAQTLAAWAKRIPGLGDAVPDNFDPSAKEAFSKLSTDLVFKAANQIGGRLTNKELEGLRLANPDTVMRPEANMDILSNLAGTQGWMGQRAKMAGQWFNEAQNLNGFDTNFNQRFPLDSYVKNIQSAMTKGGIGLPQVPGAQPGQAGAPVKNWIRQNGKLMPTPMPQAAP